MYKDNTQSSWAYKTSIAQHHKCGSFVGFGKQGWRDGIKCPTSNETNITKQTWFLGLGDLTSNINQENKKQSFRDT